MTPRCRCQAIERLAGDEGIAYARDHLRLEVVADDGWSATWSCPITGRHWRETYWPAWRASDPGERLDRLGPTAAPSGPEPSASAGRRASIPRVGIAAVSLTLIVALLADSI